MQNESKTQIGQKQVLDKSEISFNQPIFHQYHSDYAQSEQKSYKERLLKLMVLYKLDQMGYRGLRVNTLLDLEIQHVDCEKFLHEQLNNQSMKLVVNIILSLDGNEQIPSLNENINSVQQQNFENLNNQVVQKRKLPQILCSICYLLTHKYCEESCLHSFCQQCMCAYIRENISTGNYSINCPQYSCRAQISLQTIQNLLKKQEFQRYKYFKEKNDKENNPNNHFCQKADCGQLLIPNGDELLCQQCKLSYCHICFQLSHPNSKCDVVLASALENTFKNFKIKKCPNCKSPIEKSQGCNHMNCKKCKYEFCWICLKKYSNHHYRYYNCFGCPGMQFEDQEQLSIERGKQLCLYILSPLIIVLVLFCYFAAIPIFMIGSYFYKPCIWLNLRSDGLEHLIIKNIFCFLPECIQILCLWILLQPRAIIYAVLVSPIKLTCMISVQLCRIFQ